MLLFFYLQVNDFLVLVVQLFAKSFLGGLRSRLFGILLLVLLGGLVFGGIVAVGGLTDQRPGDLGELGLVEERWPTDGRRSCGKGTDRERRPGGLALSEDSSLEHGEEGEGRKVKEEEKEGKKRKEDDEWTGENEERRRRTEYQNNRTFVAVTSPDRSRSSVGSGGTVGPGFYMSSSVHASMHNYGHKMG